MLTKLKCDVRAVMDRDPACRSVLEVVLLYPGFHALFMHRIAHFLWRHQLRFLARWVSFIARFLTNIDIHPGARIGCGFFIDHGQGVVIGETAEIGEHVTMYQGATLGGTGKERGKRHPTIGDHVVISAGAKVLGSFTVGHHARIGAGAVVLKEVPPHSTVVGVPGRLVRANGMRITEKTELDHANLPDPVEAAFKAMMERVSALEKQVRELEQGHTQRREQQQLHERR